MGNTAPQNPLPSSPNLFPILNLGQLATRDGHLLEKIAICCQRSQKAGMEEEDQCFLRRFVQEFPAALKEDRPLPVSSLSRKVSLEELHGESLELGQRLLAAR
ncbi:hypothetical protein ILYODFUR_017745 [Ilyodon furcidens]|uniref:Uncharacterized protein n=1 Tax=Ilyodon furcidens TaxID=33524 RepID=A0ABV0VGE2_9TELE